GLVAVVAPAVPLPGVERNAIARADLLEALHLHDALHVVGRDDAWLTGLRGNRQHLGVGRDHALGLLVGNRVQHYEAAHVAQLTHVLDPQGTHSHHASARPALVRVPDIDAVVHDRSLRRVHADVAGPVELGADLADLGDHKLVVIDERVV